MNAPTMTRHMQKHASSFADKMHVAGEQLAKKSIDQCKKNGDWHLIEKIEYVIENGKVCPSK